MRSMPLGKSGLSAGTRVLAGLLTIVSSALGFGEWLLSILVTRSVLWHVGASPWAWKWWENVSLIVLGLVWLASTYLVAYHYPRAARKGRLWRVFAYVSLGQLLLAVLVMGLLQLLSLIVPAAE